ncbi:MAG: hypothetical protein GY939_24985 [Actinomycetia bacterium]|nr:hypothetical protein [Actinomycetes bacterium]
MSRTAEQHPPGDLLLHPVVVFAVGLLVLNDHVFKDLWANTTTGKLSDIAGVFLLPLLILSVARLLAPLRPGIGQGPTAVASAVALTGVGFAAVKLIGPVGDSYAMTIGAIRWLVLLGTVELRPIEVVRDPTDLLVLPVLIASYVVGRRPGRDALGEGNTDVLVSPASPRPPLVSRLRQ